MASMTTYLENELYDHVLRNASFTSPTTVYLGLFTSDPTDAGTQTSEVGAHPDYSSGYSRQAIAFNAPTSGSGDNTSLETFGPIILTANVTITHVALLDASTSGNMLFSEAMSESKEVSSGDIFKYPAGNITVEMD